MFWRLFQIMLHQLQVTPKIPLDLKQIFLNNKDARAVGSRYNTVEYNTILHAVQ